MRIDMQRGRRSIVVRVFGILAILSIAAGFPHAAWGQSSRFYLTVERGFAPEESPSVRLDFVRTNEPLRLRVLRPKNLEDFLDGQLNISRSYEEPLSDLNAGHYVLRGLNSVESPLKLLRNSLSDEFRNNFGDDSFNHPLMPVPSRSELIRPPDEISLGAPRGFEIVREIFVDLQTGGETARGLYDFDESYEEYRYKIRTITLDPLADGVYLLQGIQGKHEAQALMQVSGLAVQVKQAPSQLIVRVLSRGSSPVPNADISFRDGRGKWLPFPSKTDDFGQASFSAPEGMLDGRLLVRVNTAAGAQALVDTDFLPANTVDNSVFIVTDRPIFKPGEEFFFKGTLRTPLDGQMTLPRLGGAEANIKVLRADGSDTGLSKKVMMTDFASFSGSFEIPEYQSPGLYRLISEIEGKAYAGEFRVKDYVKPTFYLEMVDRDPAIRTGESFKFKFRARKYSGGRPQGARYEVFVYRKKFESPGWVEEAGEGLSAGSDYFGAVRNASALAQPQRLYSSVEARGSGLLDNPWGTAAEIPEDGETLVEIDIPKVKESDADQDWIFTILVRAQDKLGSQAVLTENMYVTQSDAVPAIRFQNAVHAADSSAVKLDVVALYPDGRNAPDASGYVEMFLDTDSESGRALGKVPFKTGTDGRTTVEFSPGGAPGRVRAIAVLEAIGGTRFRRAARSQQASVILGGDGGEAVVSSPVLELYTDSLVLSPGEKSRVFALLPAGWGIGGEGVVWETIAGSKVFESRSTQIKGRSHWLEVEARPEYGTGFYHTVTVPSGGGKFSEQTLGFRIVPADKRLQIQIAPETEIAEPLQEFKIAFNVKDGKGAPASHTELSVNVVDRAVYAVQSDFRPAILDFFYPLTRLNLASFYSDELQGYGYADEIRKPNFRLSAIKSQSQPIKRNMRDTAGWFPHVVTDENGNASVTVQMPANITEWQVTAIAIDTAGRVGEARGRFRSSSDVNVEARIPPFMRDGDLIRGALETSNATESEADVSLAAEASSGLDLTGVSGTQNLKVPAKGSVSMPLVVAGRAESGEGVMRVAAEAGSLRAGGEREFEVGMQPASADFRVVGAPQDRSSLAFDIPLGSQPKELMVRVSSGLLGASLIASSELVRYPYGCAEQLVHTTVPNLIVLDMVRRAMITPQELKVLKLDWSLDRAKRFAESGIAKLASLQKSGGGFVLWSSESEPSFPLSLVVLRALKYAKDLGVPEAERSFQSGYSWVANELENHTFPAESELAAFELSHLAEIGVTWAASDHYVNFLRRVVDDRNGSSLSEVVAALNILNEFADKYWVLSDLQRPAAKEELVARLKNTVYSMDFAASVRETSEDLSPLGFGYHRASLIASILGVLDRAGSLDDAMKQEFGMQMLRLMRNGWWRSTFDTGQIIFGLRSILEKEALSVRAKPGSPAVTVHSASGNQIGSLQAFPGGYFGSFQIASEAAVSGEINASPRISLRGLGATDFPAATLMVRKNFRDVESYGEGIVVSRVLRKITPGGSAELTGGETLHVGDVVVSDVTVARGIPRLTDSPPSSFVVVEDGVPSFAEAIEDDKTYIADAGLQANVPTYWGMVKDTERHPDRTVRVITLEIGGTLRVFNVWRVGFAGSVSIPPARAFDMYNEDIQGNSSAGILKAE